MFTNTRRLSLRCTLARYFPALLTVSVLFSVLAMPLILLYALSVLLIFYTH